MGPGEWIALVVAVVTIGGPFLALWFRAGKMMQRIETAIEGQQELKKRLSLRRVFAGDAERRQAHSTRERGTS
jgi:hypothetical protein